MTLVRAALLVGLTVAFNLTFVVIFFAFGTMVFCFCSQLDVPRPSGAVFSHALYLSLCSYAAIALFAVVFVWRGLWPSLKFLAIGVALLAITVGVSRTSIEDGWRKDESVMRNIQNGGRAGHVALVTGAFPFPLLL